MNQRDEKGRIPVFTNTLIFLLFAVTCGQGKASQIKNCALRLPEKLGKVIYQEHGGRNDRVYIVAQSHRSAITGEENEDCRQVQAEVYRIGEWLIANEKVEALLPEGYFKKSAAAGRTSHGLTGKTGPAARLDDATLAARLAEPAIFVNADRLLYATYALALRQVEDRKLYCSVVDQLRSLLDDSSQQQLDPTALTTLVYQQNKRSAVILSNIPQALTGKPSSGSSKIHRAMLTIGLSHVKTIIDFLKNGKAQVLPPHGESDPQKGFSCDLSPIKEKYSIAIIIPRSLTNEDRLLHL